MGLAHQQSLAALLQLDGEATLAVAEQARLLESNMNRALCSMVGTIVAAIASIATTLTLLWAVVSLSEPQRSQLFAESAGRQMVNQRAVALAKSGQAQPRAAAPLREPRALLRRD